MLFQNPSICGYEMANKVHTATENHHIHLSNRKQTKFCQSREKDTHTHANFSPDFYCHFRYSLLLLPFLLFRLSFVASSRKLYHSHIFGGFWITFHTALHIVRDMCQYAGVVIFLSVFFCSVWFTVPHFMLICLLLLPASAFFSLFS